jgi:hypothetical protein
MKKTKAQWKVEVDGADGLSELFVTEPTAWARFYELVKERYDYEVITLYAIGDEGHESTQRTSYGERKQSDEEVTTTTT